jgi:hypothetical protein
MSNKSIDITDRLQKIGESVSEYRQMLIDTFEDMNVEVKDWHFTVGKQEKEYTVEVNVKLCLKPKKE